MKKINYILIIVLINSFFYSCEVQKQAKVIVVQKEVSRGSGGIIYLDLTLKNEGERPAYFVVVNVKAIIDNQTKEYKEKGFGDIFPGEDKTQRLTFTDLHAQIPDDFDIEIVYQLEMT